MSATDEYCSPGIEFVVPDLSFVIEQSVLARRSLDESAMLRLGEVHGS